jgi:flagellar motor switch protein FliM
LDLLLASKGTDSPRQRLIRSAHESFARSLGAALSAFLETEIDVSLEQLALTTAGEFKKTLATPACLVSFELVPRSDWALLSFDHVAVFSLLEILLGSDTAATPAEPRALTDIEWSLLEEVVRVLVLRLGEAWRQFHEVEFKVQALESDPAALGGPDAGASLVDLQFGLRIAGQSCGFRVAVAQAFLDAGEEQAVTVEPVAADAMRNLALLGTAKVDLEVLLEGPTLIFQELSSLEPGDVIRFDYPLEKPVRAVINGAVSIPGTILPSGRKRAFRIEDPR